MPARAYRLHPEHGPRVRAGIARAKARGVRFGRQSSRVRREASCEVCGETITFVARPDAPSRRTCGRRCQGKLIGGKNRCTADAAVLHQLYVVEGRTTRAIGRLLGMTSGTVCGLLRKAGISPRPAGPPVNLPRTTCLECAAPVVRHRHTNGYLFGTRCLAHWVAYRRRLQRESTARKRANPVVFELTKRARRRGHDVISDGPERVRCLRPGCDRIGYRDDEGFTGSALVGMCRGVNAPKRRAA